MFGERIKGCAGIAVALVVAAVVVAAIVTYVFREGGGVVQRAADDPSQVNNGPLKQDQAKHPSGPAELKELMVPATKVRSDSRILAEGTTKVTQLVLWQLDGANLHFRIILTPYDAEAHQMMATPSEAMFLSFETKAGARVAPKSEPLRIETRTLRLATTAGTPAGWFFDGKIPLDPKEERIIDMPRLGWLFSKRLHARLRQLQVVTPQPRKP
jgi:hypothetical protein